MDNFSLKIEGFESNEPLPLSKEVFESFIESDYIEKQDTEIILKKDFFSDDYKVLNVCRYRLIKSNPEEYNLLSNESNDLICSAFNDFILDDIFISENKLPTIILILESPHKDEYDYIPHFKPKAPSQGETGKKIRMLESIIKLNKKKVNLSKDRYNVIIVNPVPFQTSLFYCHRQGLKGSYKNLRDYIWKSLWNYPEINLRPDLQCVIKNLNTELIINACTKNVGQLINNFLNQDEFKGKTRFSINHPFAWNIPTLTKI